MRIMVDGVEMLLEPTRWEVVYPAQVEPIGEIWRDNSGYRARLESEDLGGFDTGDEAAEAIWRRFIEQSTTQHEEASRTHGAYERHVHS